MTDIKMLPLPEHIEAGEFTFDAHVFEHTDMVSYARAVAEHNVKERDAEIEAVTAEAFEWRGLFGMAKARADKAEARAERLAEALREIAEFDGAPNTPVRNSVKKSAIARAALRDHDQEAGNG